MRRSTGAFLGFLACVALPGCGTAAHERTEETGQAMSGGTVDNGDLAVGLLFAHKTLADGGVTVAESCSGELIAPDVILTAGHCFDTNVMDSFYVGQGVAIQGGDTDWDPATVHMQKFVIDQFARPPGYKSGTGTPPTVLDVAVAHLAQRVPGVAPLGLATAPPPVNATVTTIGFGRHPTTPAPDPTCLQGCNGDCTCQQTKCGCNSVQPIFGTTCLCTDTGGYDQFVKRTASVPVAEILATTLHQTDVSQSTDLPGDSGGAVLYGGVIVGTDCCGSGPANAQTDQFFARIDLAHDWIVGQVGVFSDGGVAEGGSAAGTDGGSSGAGDAGGGDDGSGGSPGGGGGAVDDGGSASGTAPGDDAGGTSPANGGTPGSSGGSPAGGGSGGCACAAVAGGGSSPWGTGWLLALGVGVARARRRTRRE